MNAVLSLYQDKETIIVICDCQSGCILDMILYTGKSTDIAENDPVGVSGAVVREMMGS